MRTPPTLALAALILGAPVALAAQGNPIPQAQAAAEGWLTLTDRGSYGPSWEAAAALFRASITKAGWTEAIKAARAPLGALTARHFRSATYTRKLPGAPDGEYMVILFDSSFQHRPSAVETVTPMREPDGTWKVSGYYVR